jgi:4-carboxymuconolactone decarboxylase
MRLPEIDDDELTPGQREVYDEARVGKRGHVPAPVRAWIHSEQLARHANRLGEFVRYNTQLSPRLSELAILVTARYWNSKYEWYAHKNHALKAGLDPAIIDAIEERRAPHFDSAEEELIHRFAKTLHETKTITPEFYSEAQAALGDQTLVELMGLLGYYTMVAMTLNTFDVDIPAGETPLKP